jgi:hypothetical protein
MARILIVDDSPTETFLIEMLYTQNLIYDQTHILVIMVDA